MLVKLIAEPHTPKRKTWTVYVVGEGVSIEGIKADGESHAIEKAKSRLIKLAEALRD